MVGINWSDYRNRILAELDVEAFMLNELTDVQRRGHEIKAKCPFPERHEGHTDNNPSFTANLSTGVWYCNSCQSKGNVHTLYKEL